MSVLGKRQTLYVLVPIALVVVTVDVWRVYSPAVAGLVRRVFGYLMRAKEVPPPGGPISINGATWVILCATLLTWVFPISIGVAALTMFMLADAAAALIGRKFGRTPWGIGNKTLEGSVAFVLVSIGVLLFFPGVTWWAGLLAALVGGAAEILADLTPIDDNLVVPVLTAVILFLLERFVVGTNIYLFFGPGL